jgi:hypothetical protein
VTDRFAGSVRGRGGARYSRPTPVLAVLGDAGLVDTVAMTVAATGRRLLREDDLPVGTGLVLVTDTEEPEMPDLPGTDPAGTRVTGVTRVIRVSGEPGAAGPGTIQIPEGTRQLAAAIGCRDPFDVAVAGVVGGAGTSVFAAALAGAVADPGPDSADCAGGAGGAGGAGQALLVDADPLSRAGHLRVLLGAEGDTGGGQERKVTWVGDVGLVEAGGGLGERHVASPALPVVRDCGRRDLAGLPDTVTDRVLVVPQTVPAVLAARHVAAADARIHVVLRELPRSGLTWNQTLSLLGRTPTVTWEDDPFLTVDVDRGDFRTTGRGAGTAATAAVRLLEQIR